MFNVSTKLEKVSRKYKKFLCHFWWQKWRKSHAPHLWRERGTKSLKQTPLAGKAFTVFVFDAFLFRARHDRTRRSLIRRRCEVRIFTDLSRLRLPPLTQGRGGGNALGAAITLPNPTTASPPELGGDGRRPEEVCPCFSCYPCHSCKKNKKNRKNKPPTSRVLKKIPKR